jgi:hypothetical protein
LPEQLSGFAKRTAQRWQSNCPQPTRT